MNSSPFWFNQKLDVSENLKIYHIRIGYDYQRNLLFHLILFRCMEVENRNLKYKIESQIFINLMSLKLKISTKMHYPVTYYCNQFSTLFHHILSKLPHTMHNGPFSVNPALIHEKTIKRLNFNIFNISLDSSAKWPEVYQQWC